MTHRLEYHLVWVPKYRKRVLLGLWAEGYFAESVGQVTEARIKQYIQNQ